MCLGSLKLKILRTSAVKRNASNNGNKSKRQSSLGFEIQVGNGIAFSWHNSYAEGLLSIKQTLDKSDSATEMSFKKFPFLSKQD